MSKTTIPPELVADREVFSALSAECEKIINTTKCLPDFVFRHPFGRYFVIEYPHTTVPKFAAFLLRMAEVFQDESVNYMTLRPHAVKYYHDRLGFFGLASFKPSNLLESYIPVMSRRGAADSFRARGGDVGAFWGSSLKWAVFCDRISWELAVIAVPQEVDVRAATDFGCMDAAAVSSYIESLWRSKPTTALDFNQRFLANYALS